MNYKPVEVYFGDILTLRKQLLSQGVVKTHIHQSMMRARRLDPPAYMETYWRGHEWELIMQDAGQMSMYKPGSRQNKPNAVWPIFSAARHTLPDLINFCKFPYAERDDLRRDADPADWFFAPRKSQEHVVWIEPTGLARHRDGLKTNMAYHEWVQTFIDLREEYGVKFGIAHSSSMKVMFSGAFDMASISTAARNTKGELLMPNGMRLNPKEQTEVFGLAEPLVKAIGYSPKEVAEDFQKLALFNINSIQYASVNWGNDISSMRIRKPRTAKVDVQPDKSDAEVAGVRTIKKAFPAPPRVPTR